VGGRYSVREKGNESRCVYVREKKKKIKRVGGRVSERERERERKGNKRAQ